MTPAISQSGLFSESYWLKIGPHPTNTKDIFLTPPPLLQWIFNAALYISCSRYRTVVTRYCLMPGPGHCHNLCLITVSQWAPLRSQCRLSVTSLANGGHPGPAQLALSLILISSLSLTRLAIELIPVTVSRPLIGWRVAWEPSHWPRSVFIRAGYSLVKRILYIDWIWSRELQEVFVRAGCSENWDYVPKLRIKCHVKVN